MNVPPASNSQSHYPVEKVRSRRRRSPGFTLAEMLIVISIIVLVVLLAIPAFRAMTGSRSTEAAYNQMSAVLSRVRTEAMGVEEPRGVLFFRDLETQQIGMAIVRPVNTAPPYDLDLVPDRETILLPPGVGIQFIDDYTLPLPRTDDGYIGFNTRVSDTATLNETVVPYGGVILFDGQGRITTDTYAFRRWYPDPDAAGPAIERNAEIWRFLYNDAASAPPVVATPVTIAITPIPQAKLGFVLFDEEALNTLHGEGRLVAKNADTDTQVSGTTGNGPYVEAEQAEETWLDQNGVAVLVNRYNGTLLRGE